MDLPTNTRGIWSILMSNYAHSYELHGIDKMLYLAYLGLGQWGTLDNQCQYYVRLPKHWNDQCTLEGNQALAMLYRGAGLSITRQNVQ